MQHLNFSLRSSLVAILSISLLTTACDNRSASKEEVQDELEDAREATAEAQQETREAVEAQEEYYAGQREAQVDSLNDRLDVLDERIEDLQENAEETGNVQATADINAAIVDLQAERDRLKAQMAEVQSIELKDWSGTYDDIDQAVARLEGALDDLAKNMDGAQ